MKKSEKTFDCIAFKRTAQLQIYEEIKDLSREEEIAYFHNKAETGPFREWWLRRESHEAHTLCCAENELDYTAKGKKE
jgi:hypothetical protein